MPCLLYALEAYPISKTQKIVRIHRRVLMKVFCTKSVDVVQQCGLYFGITDVTSRVDKCWQNSLQNTELLRTVYDSY